MIKYFWTPNNWLAQFTLVLCTNSPILYKILFSTIRQCPRALQFSTVAICYKIRRTNQTMILNTKFYCLLMEVNRLVLALRYHQLATRPGNFVIDSNERRQSLPSNEPHPRRYGYRALRPQCLHPGSLGSTRLFHPIVSRCARKNQRPGMCSSGSRKNTAPTKLLSVNVQMKYSSWNVTITFVQH